MPLMIRFVMLARTVGFNRSWRSPTRDGVQRPTAHMGLDPEGQEEVFVVVKGQRVYLQLRSQLGSALAAGSLD